MTDKMAACGCERNHVLSDWTDAEGRYHVAFKSGHTCRSVQTLMNNPTVQVTPAYKMPYNGRDNVTITPIPLQVTAESRDAFMAALVGARLTGELTEETTPPSGTRLRKPAKQGKQKRKSS